MEQSAQISRPAFAKLRTVLKDHGIGVTAGYELIAAGLIKTFKIGKATYAELEQFDHLPERLQDPDAIARLAQIKRAGKPAQ